MTTLSNDARERLAEVIERLLSEWKSGYDWKWHAGQPSYDVGLDDIDLDKSDPAYKPLLAVWHFIDAFADARWHGFPEIDGLPWDKALQLMTDTCQRLRDDLPIQDPHMLRYM